MDGELSRPGREERHRKRVRAAMVEMRRCFLTAMKAIERFEAEEAADDAGTVAVLPGHSADLPRTGNRPPAQMTNHR